MVDEIVAAGGEAVANTDDIADWDGARRLVHTAIDTFGGLDVLVNNAGFLRDRMVFTTGEDEWDAVIRVHLKGHFATTRHATEWWRAQSKAGATVDGRHRQHVVGRGPHGLRSARARTRPRRPASPRSRSSRRPRWRATA